MSDSGVTDASKSSSTHHPCQRVTLSSAPTTHRIAPESGTAVLLHKGQVLRGTDPLGQQVSDLFAFEQDNLNRWLSADRSIDHASKTKLNTGDTPYSNDSQPMFTILGDTVGHHDFVLTPCSQEMFEILYGCIGHHPSCFENLVTSLAVHGVTAAQIRTRYNIFMQVNVDTDGSLKVGVPRSKAGHWIELRTEMNLICGLTACSAEGSNNGTFKPIDYAVGDIAGFAGSDGSVGGVQGRCLTRSDPCNGENSVQSQPQEVRQQRVLRGKLGKGVSTWTQVARRILLAN